MPHRERHRTERIGWLRAAVLGANDGIVSTASLVLGVAAAHATSHDILVAGVAGLVAGAMSMAAGEYVSVSSQADTEQADLALESKRTRDRSIRRACGTDGDLRTSAASILRWRNRSPNNSRLMTPWPPMPATNLASPTRSEPDRSRRRSHRRAHSRSAQPCPADRGHCPWAYLIPLVAGLTLFLAIWAVWLRSLAVQVHKAITVTFWGALAMALTAGVGALFGAVVKLVRT